MDEMYFYILKSEDIKGTWSSLSLYRKGIVGGDFFEWELRLCDDGFVFLLRFVVMSLEIW